MWIPTLRGRIDRRVLVNFRVDPAVLAKLVPPPFRPQLVGGFGLAGICLIRLAEVRIAGMPRALGIGSENAAHRVAVEWSEGGTSRNGVYIPRRDTSSRLNTLAGGLVFPGEHHLARFDVDERDGEYRIAMQSADGCTQLSVVARLATTLPPNSVFASVAEASRFFEKGSVGYSVTRCPTELDALELRTFGWAVEPLRLESVSSSWFSDLERFPEHSVELDSAFLMRGLEHEWRGRGLMRCGAAATAA